MDAVKNFSDFNNAFERRIYFETVEALENFLGSITYASRWLGISYETFRNRLRKWPQLGKLLRNSRGPIKAEILRSIEMKMPPKPENTSEEVKKSLRGIDRIIECEVEKAKKTYTYRLASPKERAEILRRHRD